MRRRWDDHTISPNRQGLLRPRPPEEEQPVRAVGGSSGVSSNYSYPRHPSPPREPVRRHDALSGMLSLEIQAVMHFVYMIPCALVYGVFPAIQPVVIAYVLCQMMAFAFAMHADASSYKYGWKRVQAWAAGETGRQIPVSGELAVLWREGRASASRRQARDLQFAQWEASRDDRAAMDKLEVANRDLEMELQDRPDTSELEDSLDRAYGRIRLLERQLAAKPKEKPIEVDWRVPVTSN